MNIVPILSRSLPLLLLALLMGCMDRQEAPQQAGAVKQTMKAKEAPTASPSEASPPAGLLNRAPSPAPMAPPAENEESFHDDGAAPSKAERKRAAAEPMPLDFAGKGGEGGATAAPPPPPVPAMDKNAYYSSSYQGGHGDADRVKDLIGKGIVVDGKTVQLQSFTRGYEQAFALPTDKAVELFAAPDRGALEETGGQLFLQVGLQGIKQEAPRRPGLNICLVIDRSGSMKEESKMEGVKRAAKRFVEGLKETDILSIVAYDNEAETIWPAGPVQDRPALLKTVASMDPGGGTNIHEGLVKGYQEARRHMSKEKVNLLVLLSDGIITAGISDSATLRSLVTEAFDEGVQTTSIGVGVEFNDALMLSLAQAGQGNYHFIRDSASVEEIFKRELDELTHVVAKALKIRILLPQGVELVRILGSPQLSSQEQGQVKQLEKNMDQRIYEELGIKRDRPEEDEPGIKMFVPHFYLGDSHVVMMELRLAQGQGTKVAEVFLKYKDLVFGQNRDLVQRVEVKRVATRAESIATMDRKVKKNLLGFQTGEALIEASNLMAARDNRQALRLIDEQMTLLAVASKEWADQDLANNAQVLSQYRGVLAKVGTGANDQAEQVLRKSLSYSGFVMTR